MEKQMQVSRCTRRSYDQHLHLIFGNKNGSLIFNFTSLTRKLYDDYNIAFNVQLTGWIRICDNTRLIMR